jgi:peptidoglycan hydrolase-like protein with peptidoglycan-binding domain
LVQSGLSELGYSPGPVDGLLGDQTRDAIRKFERDRRLPASGEISVRLIDELRKITGLSVLSALESAR